jgi:hypothetical protein
MAYYRYCTRCDGDVNVIRWAKLILNKVFIITVIGIYIYIYQKTPLSISVINEEKHLKTLFPKFGRYDFVPKFTPQEKSK